MKRFTIFGLALGLAMLATPYVSAQSNDEEPKPTQLTNYHLILPGGVDGPTGTFEDPLNGMNSSFMIGLPEGFAFYDNTRPNVAVLEGIQYDDETGDIIYKNNQTIPTGIDYICSEPELAPKLSADYRYWNLQFVEENYTNGEMLIAPGCYTLRISGFYDKANPDITYAPIYETLYFAYPVAYNLTPADNASAWNLAVLYLEFPNRNASFYQPAGKQYDAMMINPETGAIYYCETAWNVTAGENAPFRFELTFIDDEGNGILNINEPTTYMVIINALETVPELQALPPIIAYITINPVENLYTDYYFLPGYKGVGNFGYNTHAYNTNVDYTIPIQNWLNGQAFPYNRYDNLTTVTMVFPNVRNVYFYENHGAPLITLKNLTTGTEYVCATPEKNSDKKIYGNGIAYDFNFVPQDPVIDETTGEVLDAEVVEPGFYCLTVNGAYIQDVKGQNGYNLEPIEVFYEIGYWPAGIPDSQLQYPYNKWYEYDPFTIKAQSPGTSSSTKPQPTILSGWELNRYQNGDYNEAGEWVPDGTYTYYYNHRNNFIAPISFNSFNSLSITFPFTNIAMYEPSGAPLVTLVNNTTGKEYTCDKPSLKIDQDAEYDKAVWTFEFKDEEGKNVATFTDAGLYTLTIKGLYYVDHAKVYDYGTITQTFTLNSTYTNSYPFYYNLTTTEYNQLYRNSKYAYWQLYNIDDRYYQQSSLSGSYPYTSNGLLAQPEALDQFETLYFSFKNPNGGYPLFSNSSWYPTLNQINYWDITYTNPTITLVGDNHSYIGYIDEENIDILFATSIFDQPKPVKKDGEIIGYAPAYNYKNGVWTSTMTPSENPTTYPYTTEPILTFPIKFTEIGGSEPTTVKGGKYLLTIKGENNTSGFWFLYNGKTQYCPPIYAAYEVEGDATPEPDGDGEGDTSAVGKIEAAQADSYNVYNLNGVQIISNGTANDLNNLDAGFYIVNGKKVVIRK